MFVEQADGIDRRSFVSFEFAAAVAPWKRKDFRWDEVLPILAFVAWPTILRLVLLSHST